MDTLASTARTDSPPLAARIVVVGADTLHVDALAVTLRGASSGWQVTPVHGGPAQMVAALGRADPDVAVLDAPGDCAAALAPLERALQVYPRMQVVLLADDHSPELLRTALRAGVRDVLPRNLDAAQLLAAVRRVIDARATERPREGRVLAFMACKGGGSGATFIATNVAYALAEAGQRVILLDLNLQWGDASMFLTDRKPTANLATLAAQIERVDAMLLASSLVPAHANLGILAAPDDPVHALDVRPEHIDVVLRLARAHYDVVVLDVGRALDAVTVRALDYADCILPVLQLTLPFVRDGRRLMDAFRSLGYTKDKIRPVVNRYEKGGPVKLDDLEHALGVPACVTLPNDFGAVSSSINQGVPVTQLARRSAIAHAIREFACTLTQQPVAAPAGWLSRMLGRA
jgi:pilus assembly protein CpaE